MNAKVPVKAATDKFRTFDELDVGLNEPIQPSTI